jgi:uncharacterized membrane protein
MTGKKSRVIYNKPVKKSSIMSDKLPEQQSNSPQKQSGQVLVTETSVNFSPLPPAQELERLNQIQPGIVERILRMAEREQEIRHEHTREVLQLEKRNLQSLNFNIRLSFFLGFGSVLVSTGMCGYFAYLGNIEAAADAAKWVIVSLAAVFITGRFLQHKRKGE